MEILNEVVESNASWSTEKDGGLYEIPRGCPTRHVKAWFYFMSKRLLPSKHVSIVYREQCCFVQYS